MALRLLPFRQYSDYDVINLFANQIVDSTLQLTVTVAQV